MPQRASLPPWAVVGARLLPLSQKAHQTLAWFGQGVRKAAYMKVNLVDPGDTIPIHLVAYTPDDQPMGSTNLWAKERGNPERLVR